MGKDEGGYEAGGCVVTDSDPDYSCTDCDYKWMHSDTYYIIHLMIVITVNK